MEPARQQTECGERPGAVQTLEQEWLETTGVVFNIQRYSVHDGPGIRTIVFLKGCPLRCAWCSNPESQNPKPERAFLRKKCIRCGVCAGACPNGAIRFDAEGYPDVDRSRCDSCGACARVCCADAMTIEGRIRTVGEVLRVVEKDRAFYENSGGGMTLSGGEALMQPVFARALMAAARARGIHVAIETTGLASPEVLRDVLMEADLVLYDLKHVDEALHRAQTGAGLERILSNLAMLTRLERPLAVRIPVVPGFNGSMADAAAIGRVLVDAGVREVHLLPFHQLGAHKYDWLGIDYSCGDLKSLRDEELEPYCAEMTAFGLKVRIGG